MASVNRALEQVDITMLRGEIWLGLSGDERQRVRIAHALPSGNKNGSWTRRPIIWTSSSNWICCA